MKKKICAFTGHRPQSLPFGFNETDDRCVALKEMLRRSIIKLIEEEGVAHFITGMALGVDMYAAEIVLSLKATYHLCSVQQRPFDQNNYRKNPDDEARQVCWGLCSLWLHDAPDTEKQAGD